MYSKKKHREQTIEAHEYHREALVTKTLVAFDHYKKVQMAKRAYQSDICESMKAINKRRTFNGFRKSTVH